MDMNADDAATNLAQIGVRLQQLARWLRVAPGAGGEAATELVRATRRDLVELEQQVTRRRRYALAVEVKDLLARHSLPLRLHLGAEGAGVPGWVNCGLGDCELRLDVIERLPFDDAVASHVYASHLLEHLMYPGQVAAFLRECRRVLVPDGVLRLVVPDMGKFLQAVASNDEAFLSHRARVWNLDGRSLTPLSSFLRYAGASCDPTSAAHKFGYDYQTLESLLCDAGFSRVRQCGYMESPDPILHVDVHSRVNDRVGPRGHYSLFVEAIQ